MIQAIQTSFNFDKKAVMTPMMKQYLSIKKFHTNCLLFYRMGDFYELFFEDAEVASDILDVALTKRGKISDQDIPMCGVPAHCSEIYILKLIKAGHKVAICDQLESPEEAKKRGYKAVVHRDVVRIITPGTILEDTLLESKNTNYLCALSEEKGKGYISWMDISTGEFYISSISINNMASELARLNPKEILCSENFINNIEHQKFLNSYKSIITTRDDSIFKWKKGESIIKNFFQIETLESISNLLKLVKSILSGICCFLFKYFDNIKSLYNFLKILLKLFSFSIFSLLYNIFILLFNSSSLLLLLLES